MSYGPSPLTTLAATLSDGLSAVLGRFVAVARRSNGSYVDFPASSDGHPLVEIVDPTSAFVEGEVNWLGTRRARYASRASIGTLGTDPTPILTLRNPSIGGGGYTTHSVPLIIKGFNAASTTAQAGEIQFIRNATLTGDSFGDIDNTMTPAKVDTTAASMSGGRLIESMTIGSSVTSPARREFGDHEIILAPGEQVTLAAFAYSGNMTARGTINWIDGI